MLYAITSNQGPLLESGELAENLRPIKVARLYGSRELAVANLPSDDLAKVEEVDDALAWLVTAEQHGATHVVEIHDNGPIPEPSQIKHRIGQLRASMTINCDPKI